jgi:hypothetical protein
MSTGASNESLLVLMGLSGCLFVYLPIFLFIRHRAKKSRPVNTSHHSTTPPNAAQSSGTLINTSSSSSTSSSDYEKPDKPEWQEREEREAREERDRDNWERSYTKKFIDFLRD